jgi:soluble lytic murein transglycosylase
MFRFAGKLFLVLLAAAVLGAGSVLLLSDDPLYTAAEWMSLGRFKRYDTMIADVAHKHGVDPLLIKAIVWRESEFHPDKKGTSGERGLMQVSEGAAADWARANKVETFTPNALFAPRMNLEIGTWYFKKALQRWASKDDPVPFALAEYNAGKTRVDRWIEGGKMGPAVTADDLRVNIDFPSTRAYVDTIVGRYRHYKVTENK